MRKILPWLFVVLFSCKKESKVDTQPDNATGTVTLNFNSTLMDLGSAAQYEGWIVVNGNMKSIGKFTVNSSGLPSQAIFTLSATDIKTATNFVLTLEPNPDASADPSRARFLSGTFNNNTAALTTGDSRALGSDFTAVNGVLTLETPTTYSTSDELSGVWFLQNSSGTELSGIKNLPLLPNGWLYEGWAYINGIPVSIGKFSRADSIDLSNPFIGALPAPHFPGEDFIQSAPLGVSFPSDLSGQMVVVTIEPNPDYNSQPFFLTMLHCHLPSPAASNTPYSFINMADYFPSGTAVRKY